MSARPHKTNTLSSITLIASLKSLYDELYAACANRSRGSDRAQGTHGAARGAGRRSCSSMPGWMFAVSVLCAVAHGRSQSSARSIHFVASHCVIDSRSDDTYASLSRKRVELAEPYQQQKVARGASRAGERSVDAPCMRRRLCEVAAF